MIRKTLKEQIKLFGEATGLVSELKAKNPEKVYQIRKRAKGTFDIVERVDGLATYSESKKFKRAKKQKKNWRVP